MRYFIDSEFYDRQNAVELISIALVAEDGRELYLENADFDWFAVPADHWIQANVRPHLKGEYALTGHNMMGNAIRQFIGDDKPRFWGYFADFDWVLFCWIFGSMVELPVGWPQFCRDLKQWAVLHGDPPLLPQSGTAHNALEDARWTRLAFDELAKAVGIEHP